MRKIPGSKVLFLWIPIALLLLGGCGSSHKEAPPTTTTGQFGTDPATGIQFVGASTCINCHKTLSFSTSIIPAFLNSIHVVHSTSISASSPSSCLVCHDPIGDGRTLESMIDPANVPSGGLAAVTCEDCHGPGGQHYGTGPIPYPDPDYTRCGNTRCHTSNLPALADHPAEGMDIVGEYESSKHATSIRPPNLAPGSTTDVRALCSKCHTDEGARQYSFLHGNFFQLEAAFSNSTPPIANASVVQCRTCHMAHDPTSLLLSAATVNGAAWSDQFSTCTNCHQLLDFTTGAFLSNTAFHDPAVNPFGVANEIITDTHYDNPNTPQRAANGTIIVGTGGIEGYVVNTSSTHDDTPYNNNQGTCLDCHNQHNANLTTNNPQNRQWANSAHGGFILTIKTAAGNSPAIHTAAVDNAAAPAWIHYDFKGASRRDCQRCHTSTGFRNFANAQPIPNQIYNAVNNVFTATGQQAEMLYCWACHYNNVGGLRNPGPFANTAPPDVIPPAGRTVPDLNGANICESCHTGRETGQFVKNYVALNNTVGVTGYWATQNFGTYNSHYLAAGGTIFRITGFEFAGQDYSNSPDYLHFLIGMPGGPAATGTNGPCVGCHMHSTDVGHTLEPVTRAGGPMDLTGPITAIPANDQICANCHNGTTVFVQSTTIMQGLHDGYNAALTALTDMLASKGIYYSSEAYPYYYSNTTLTTPFANWPDENTLGAAYNNNLLTREPGGYVHNSDYARHLIFDSIDFLQNGSFTGTINLTAVPGLSATDQQNAANWFEDTIPPPSSNFSPLNAVPRP